MCTRRVETAPNAQWWSKRQSFNAGLNILRHIVIILIYYRYYNIYLINKRSSYRRNVFKHFEFPQIIRKFLKLKGRLLKIVIPE
jgi:hypothetical protein